MLQKIIALYKSGKNERQIKDELLLQGFSNTSINKSFNQFIKKYNTVTEVFNIY